MSILFVDVDGMKDVNDTHGHHAGDFLLVDVAHLLRDSCREMDVVARYGGDEFVVLMPATGAAGAAAVERKVEAAIAPRNAAATAPPYLSASTGTHSATAEGVDTLLQEADRRMYAAKRYAAVAAARAVEVSSTASCAPLRRRLPSRSSPTFLGKTRVPCSPPSAPSTAG